MKRATMTAPGQIQIEDVPPPAAPGPGEVLLRVQRIGVCGSDIHVFHGKHPYTSYPVIQGHELSAVVEAVGPGVTVVAPGRKVTAMPQIVCGACPPCRRGDYHICDRLKVQGFQAPGAAQELWITRADSLVPLPDDFSFEQGALVEPVSVAVHSVARVGDLAGRRVAVLGAGPIGNLVAQTATAAGARVLITDLSDHRLDIARRCGLEHVSSPRHETLREASERIFGPAGFDVAFECVGVEPTVTAAIDAIQKGGTLVVVGVFAERPRVDMGLVQDRELKILGTLMYQRSDYERAVELIATGKVVTEPLMSKHFAMAEFLEAYRFLEGQRDQVMKVFIDVA